MTDPMDALNELQSTLDAGTIRLNPCNLYSEINVFLDYPSGRPRYTYAYVSMHKVQAISLFALTERHDGIPCFQIGYAVIDKMRGQGLGSRILQQSIGELANGFHGTVLKEFYFEAIVSTNNDPSNAIARKLISAFPNSCIDEFSNEPALQYLRKIET